MASFDFSLSHPASLVKSGLKFHKRTSLINGWHHGGYIHPLHADLAEPIVNTKLNIYLKRNASDTQTNQRSNSKTKDMEHRNVKKKKRCKRTTGRKFRSYSETQKFHPEEQNN